MTWWIGNWASHFRSSAAIYAKLKSAIYSKVELGKIISLPIANLKLEHMGTVDAKLCVVLCYGYICQVSVYGKIKEIGPWSALSLKVTLSAFYFHHLANKNMRRIFRWKLNLTGRSNNVTEVYFRTQEFYSSNLSGKYWILLEFGFLLLYKTVLFVPSLALIHAYSPSCMWTTRFTLYIYFSESSLWVGMKKYMMNACLYWTVCSVNRFSTNIFL